MMSNTSYYGLRCRGTSPGLPSVSRFRSGYMPSAGINVNEVIGNLSESESDMDTSDSEVEQYGAQFSPEASSSPQDGRTPNVVLEQNGYMNVPSGIYRRVGNGMKRKQGNSGAVAYDESPEYGSSPEVNSTESLEINGVVSEKKIRPVDKFSSADVQENVRQDFYDDDIPTAPPLDGSVRDFNKVLASRVPESNASCSETSGSSAPEAESPAKYKSTISDSGEASIPERPFRNSATAAATDVSSHKKMPTRYPTFHASELGHWQTVISYDACVRLCLNAWARGCNEAPHFLQDECSLLREAFGLKHILLQSEEELQKKDSSDHVRESTFMKTKKTDGKIKLQVRKVKLGEVAQTGCSCLPMKSSSRAKLESLEHWLSNVKSAVSSEKKARRIEHKDPSVIVHQSFVRRSMENVTTGAHRCMKEVPEIVKDGFNARRSNSACPEVVEESFTCLVRLKSSPKEDAATMQPGSHETRIFLPEGLGDDLIIEVHDSTGNYCGRAVVQVADITEGEKFRQCFIYREPEHKKVGKIQLYISYSTIHEENSHKYAFIAETIAYDCVLETAMKVQHFQQRNLLLHGSWRWLVTEFSSYFGVSVAYSKIRYLSYVMDVATPTEDCLDLVHDFLQPVIIKSKNTHSLSHQEVRLLGQVCDQIEEILTLVFENYKSLDESLPSGLVDVFGPATPVAAPALAPAFKIYGLLHDILLPEVQSKLCSHFQTAAMKRCKRHLLETDELISVRKDNLLMDLGAVSQAYKKMKSLCLNIRHEIHCDIKIQNEDIIPSFIDLPNLSSSIYSTELYSRLQAFLASCPPTGPSPPVVELVVAAADFHRDLSLWNISYIKGGVDAKELFHSYISIWIQDKRCALLELCKLDKGKSLSVSTRHSPTPLVSEIYNQLKEMMAEYEVIISRWPEFTFPLENAVADVERALLGRLEKEYADVLSPLKENKISNKFGLKFVQKLTKGNMLPYVVSTELGSILNSMRRMLDVLHPQIEEKVKLWGTYIPQSGNMIPGENLSEITVMIRSKFRAYLQAVIDKLVENTKLHSVTKLKIIIQNARENGMEEDLRNRMQPLKQLLANTIDQLNTVLEPQVFVAVSRGFWDGMGQDMLKFLGGKKENKLWHKASRIVLTALDDTFASQMQKLLGNALQEKHIEPPRGILEVRSMLCKDSVNHKGSNYYY